MAAAPPPEAAPVAARGDDEAAATPESRQIEADPPAAGPVAAAEPAQAEPPAPPRPSSPRAACGSRTNFSLYYCMQSQCKRGYFFNHPQCIHLREHDEVM